MIAVLLLMLSVSPASAASLEARLAGEGVASALFAGMEVESESRAAAGALRSLELEAAGKDGHKVHVVVTRGSREALRTLIRDRRQKLLNAFLPRNLANGKFLIRDCRPNPQGQGPRVGFELFVDKRLRGGVCDKAAAKFTAAVAFIMCPESAMEIYYYSPPKKAVKGTLDKLLEVGCPGKEEARL